MTILTKSFDEVYPDYDWYTDELDFFVTDLETQGIDVGTDTRRSNTRSYTTPAISWDIGSCNEGCAFDARIRWPKFLEANPSFQVQLPEWYMLLVANPDYMIARVSREGRDQLRMGVALGHDYPTIVESGFFAGVSTEELEVLSTGDDALENYIFDVCNIEAGKIHTALEKQYEWLIEEQKERHIEEAIEQHRDNIKVFISEVLFLGVTATRPQIIHILDTMFEDVDEMFDWDDVYTIGLIEITKDYRYQITAKGKELMK